MTKKIHKCILHKNQITAAKREINHGKYQNKWKYDLVNNTLMRRSISSNVIEQMQCQFLMTIFWQLILVLRCLKHLWYMSNCVVYSSGVLDILFILTRKINVCIAILTLFQSVKCILSVMSALQQMYIISIMKYIIHSHSICVFPCKTV